MAAARPLRAWRGAQLDAFAAILRAAAEAWASAWRIALPRTGDVRCAHATNGMESRHWACLGTREEGGAWIALPPDFDRRIARALFALEDARTPVVRSIVSACGLDLRRRIGSALQVRDTERAAALPQPAGWSGDVIVRLHEEVQVFATAALLELLLTLRTTHTTSQPAMQGSPLVPLARALERRRVDLQVVLAGCEIDLGTLHALQPGDVLPIEHGLSTPAEVRAATGEALFGARLVRSGDSRAVELEAAPVSGKEVAS